MRSYICGAQHIAAAGFVHTDISSRNVLECASDHTSYDRARGRLRRVLPNKRRA